MDPVSGQVVGGKYRLERPLARGGMGAVWVGRHLGLDSPVAVKFMDVSDAKGAVTSRARFALEAKAAASLRSSHVVQVLDYDAASDSPYIVMELLEGEDLGERLKKWGRLELAEVTSIVTQLSRGLLLAHEAGIVHRDLKPSNVFLARVGVEEVVKILDFGVAKETRLDGDQGQTTTGLVVGSPSYMSPEQARGGRVDARSDLWSVGVLIFQALTGKRPFEGANLGDVLVRICSDALPSASKLAPDLPPGIDAFFERALSRSPDGRFEDAWALADALAAVAGGSPMPPRRMPDSSSGVRKADPSSSGQRLLGAKSQLLPRDEATGSLVSQSDPTVQAAVNKDGTLRMAKPADDSSETVKAVAVSLPAAPDGIELVPASVARAEAGSATQPIATANAGRGALAKFRDEAIAGDVSITKAPAPSRKGVYWVVGAAALVVAAWGVLQTGLFGSGSKANAALSESLPPMAASPSVSAPATSASAGTVPQASAHSDADRVSPSATASANIPPTMIDSAAPKIVPHAVVRGSARPHGTSSVAVDPKFGLPTEHSP